jgi:hypothetical protein
MASKPDPTKDPEFQKVVRHFLNTPPKPHKSLADTLHSYPIRLGKS